MSCCFETGVTFAGLNIQIWNMTFCTAAKQPSAINYPKILINLQEKQDTYLSFAYKNFLVSTCNNFFISYFFPSRSFLFHSMKAIPWECKHLAGAVVTNLNEILNIHWERTKGLTAQVYTGCIKSEAIKRMRGLFHLWGATFIFRKGEIWIIQDLWAKLMIVRLENTKRVR